MPYAMNTNPTRHPKTPPHSKSGFSAPKSIDGSGQDQSPTLGFRNRIAKLTCGFDPVTNRFLGTRERGLQRGTVRRATGELGHFRDEDLILIAPVDNDLVF